MSIPIIMLPSLYLSFSQNLNGQGLFMTRVRFLDLYFFDRTVPAPSTTTMQRIYGLNSLLTVRFYDTWKNNDDATSDKFI